jgi:hypothetical protein
MKNLKTYESFLAQAGGDYEYPDPEEVLEGDDLKVWKVISRLSDDIWDIEDIQSSLHSQRMEPIITTIIDQTKNSLGYKRSNEPGPTYYIMINNYGDNKGYVEIETELNTDSYNISFENAQRSSHGYPASYGYTVFEYNKKTGKISWDKDFFQHFIR